MGEDSAFYPSASGVVIPFGQDRDSARPSCFQAKCNACPYKGDCKNAVI